MKRLLDIIRKGRNYSEYEYCTNCDARLSLQRGFTPSLDYWVCLGCGQILINPKYDFDIVWRCDGCGDLLNIQSGFDEASKKWLCKKCGYVNMIDETELFDSEDELRAYENDPYRGISDEAMLELSLYSEEGRIEGAGDVCLVRHKENGRLYVRKLLQFYEKSIYDYLMEHPIENMPGVIACYEGNNRLIVIEEYIEGETVYELLGRYGDGMPKDMAVHTRV